MMTKDVEYDPAKMLGDIKRPKVYMQAVQVVKGNNVGGQGSVITWIQMHYDRRY